MTAKGKINTSALTAGDRIIVRVGEGVSPYDAGSVFPSTNKTGEGVQVARVVSKTKVANRRGYYVLTSAGAYYAEPIQTAWLAPEDAAGVKRAHAEALDENKRQDRAATAAEVTTAAATDEVQTVREAAVAARNAGSAAEAAQIIEKALGLPAGAGAEWAKTNWVKPADKVTVSKWFSLANESADEDAALAEQESVEESAAADTPSEDAAAESETYNLAQAEAARAENEAPGGIYHGTEWSSEARAAAARPSDTWISLRQRVDQYYDWINRHGYRGPFSWDAQTELVDKDHDEALKENNERAGAARRGWAAEKLAAAGVTAETHMVKFDGTVLPRPVHVPEEVANADDLAGTQEERWHVHMDRLGRSDRGPLDLTVEVSAARAYEAGQIIAEEVHRAARGRLVSRDFSVLVHLDKGVVSVTAGFQSAGTGTVTKLPAGRLTTV